MKNHILLPLMLNKFLVQTLQCKKNAQENMKNYLQSSIQSRLEAHAGFFRLGKKWFPYYKHVLILNSNFTVIKERFVLFLDHVCIHVEVVIDVDFLIASPAFKWNNKTLNTNHWTCSYFNNNTSSWIIHIFEDC